MKVTGHIDQLAVADTHPARPRPASIRDVAKAAGVSHQTVSRVINDHPGVTPATRRLVLESIQRLRFRPNRAARTLAGGKVETIMVITANTTLYGYAATLKGIEEEARSNGLSVGITVLASASAAAVQAAVEHAIQPNTAVIVIAFDLAGELVLRTLPLGVQLAAAVQSRPEPPTAGQPWVWLDDRDAARQATSYLLDLGHRTVHYVDLPSSGGDSQRTAGWREALEAAGVQVPSPTRGGWDSIAGYRAGRILAADPDVTGILCGNDDLALGVLSALREAGRAVPADVSVVGFDDMPQSAFFSPALTTARLDFVGLGHDCVRLLMASLDAGGADGSALARRGELIVRRSSGPSPRPRPPQ